MKKFSLSLIICALLVAISVAICVGSCDLFNGPKDDVLQKISEEKRWADAPKLAVRVEFPSIWGTSKPQQGNITTAMDIRLDYEFSVEFIPDSIYSLQTWLAYFTEDLEGLTDSGSWVENPGLLGNINSLGPEDITLPEEPDPSGGTFTFTIHTVKPVTLVPSCDTKPRITRTEPIDIRGSSQPVSRAADIVLYFNGALNRETVEFADADIEDVNGIWITSETGDNVAANKDEKWYSDPEYAAVGGFFTVTMYCLTMPPADSLMTVTVKGIKNAQGEEMDKAGYSFSWRTSSAQNVGFISWSAKYNHNSNNNSGRIEIEYVSTGEDATNGVKKYYRLNKGAAIDLDSNVIEGIPGPNYSGVQAGGQITGIREYEIVIELYAQGIMENKASIKIWNIPGMEVSKENPAVEIRTAEELEAVNTRTEEKNNLDKQYVLAKDITITDEWTPIGSISPNNQHGQDFSPFTGNFYGNGHKITFDSSSSIGGTTIVGGLFGSVGVEGRDEQNNVINAKPSVIRDFTLKYNSPAIDVTVNNTQGNGLAFGGVAGKLNNTNVSNITTSGGTLAVTVQRIEPIITTDNEGNTVYRYPSVSLGGIAGQINLGKIENCRATLSVNYTSNGHIGDVNIGAVVGAAQEGNTNNNLHLDNKYNFKNNLDRLHIDGVTVAASVNAYKGLDNGHIRIGGAVGRSEVNTLNKIMFIDGTVSFSESSKRFDSSDSTRPAENNCGGVVGNSSGTNIVECSFSGNLGEAALASTANIGGLTGKTSARDRTDDVIYIHNCRVRANIVLQNNTLNEVSNGNGVMVGGVFGSLGNWLEQDYVTHVYITDCFFDDGKITVNKSINNIQLSGVVAALFPNITINNCGTRKGTITIGAIVDTEDTADTLRIGGFSPYLTGEVYNSFSKIDIILDNVNSKDCIVGGFVAQVDRGMTLENCYAAGTVSVAGNASKMMRVGGLVGVSGGIIRNCYALGNVQADNRGYVINSESSDSGETRVGGLVGHCEDGNEGEDYGLIENCFSAGQVSAKSLNQATAGGIAGIGTKIKKTAVLGKSVTAKGMLVFTPPEASSESNPNPKPSFYLRSIVGRINGEHQSYRKGVKNYAFNKMIIEEGEYSSNDPGTRGANYVSRLEAVDEENVELYEGKEVVKSYKINVDAEPRNGIFKVITANDWKVAYYDNYENILEDKNGNEWVSVDLTTTRDGQDASSSTFINQSFWKTTLGFPEKETKIIDGVSVSVPVWDFSRVARDGHPSLKNVEGQ